MGKLSLLGTGGHEESCKNGVEVRVAAEAVPVLFLQLVLI